MFYVEQHLTMTVLNMKALALIVSLPHMVSVSVWRNDTVGWTMPGATLPMILSSSSSIGCTSTLSMAGAHSVVSIVDLTTI